MRVRRRRCRSIRATAITCTFTNKKDATVTVIKDAVPNAAQDFAFTTTGSQLSGFSLDDDGDGTLSNTKVFTVSGAGFGEKTVSESAVAGWSLTDITCSEGSDAGSTATIQVDPGDTITCTFTNKKDATVTIIKDAVPNAAQDFAFTTTGAGLSGFSLDDDADATLSNTKVFTVSGADFGQKTISESAVAGWSLTDITCSEGSDAGSTATIQVDPGDSITCTFTNKQDATVTVIKDAVPNAAQDFAFTTTGAGLSSFSLDDDADATLSNTKVFTVSGADFGQKTVTESAVAGWSLTDITCSEGSDAGITATIQVDPGDTITCTFTNKQDATVTIIKDAVPNDAQDFAFTTTGSQLSGFSLDDDGDGTLSNTKVFTVSGAGFGEKTVSESAVAGWSLTDITCSEGSDAGSTATIQVDPGDTITCTFTNKKDATVTVIKDAVPNDAQDFAFTTTGSQLSGFSLDDDADGTLSNTKLFTVSGAGFGAKTVTEGDVDGWALTSLTCDDDDFVKVGKTAELDVEPGEQITCTFVNQKAATVTIVKDAVPNSAQDFGYTGSFGPFSLDDDSDATLDNDKTFVVTSGEFGSKTVTETPVAGWTNTSLVCSEGIVDGSTATLQVDPGDEITCTYVNKQDATVTIVKDAVPNAAQDFAFTTTGSQLSGFSLDDDADGTLSNTKVFTVSGAGFGEKTVSESAVAGWSLTDITCSEGSDAGSTATLQVDPGDAITCTFTNKQDATVTVIKDAVPNAAQDFAFTTTGSQLSGFSLDDDGDGTLSNTKVFTVSGAGFGEKTVSESAVAGWSLTDITCSEGSDAGSTATLQVDPGDAITCTFTNKQDATVTMIKDAVPNGPQDFAFTTTGSQLSGFSLDDDADGTLSNTKVFTVSGAGFGSKTVTESALVGWDLTALECSEGEENLGTRTATLSVDPGDQITCTYTNTERGSVTVLKTEAGSDELALDWRFELSGNGIEPVTKSTGDGNPIEFGNLVPGPYTLCEVDMPIAWHSSLEEAPYNGTRTENVAAGTAKVCIDGRDLGR